MCFVDLKWSRNKHQNDESFFLSDEPWWSVVVLRENYVEHVLYAFWNYPPGNNHISRPEGKTGKSSTQKGF